jgi:hypothetical protein
MSKDAGEQKLRSMTLTAMGVGSMVGADVLSIARRHCVDLMPSARDECGRETNAGP